MRKVTKFFKTKATSIDEDAKTITFAISTSQKDRDGEVVDQKSWDFKDYKENPQFLWGHDRSEPENVLGQCLDVQIAKDGEETLGTFHFDTDINSKADLVFKQLARGSLRTVSCGFMTGSVEYVKGIPHLLNNKLLEVSVVPIPSNAGAMAKDLKAGVISKKDARWLLESMERETDFIEKQMAQVTNDKDDDVDKEQFKQMLQQNGALLEAVTRVAEGQAATNERLDSLATKGPVADILNAGDPWLIEDAKWDNLAPLSAMYYAFCEAYNYSGTPIESFEDLLKEFIGLASQLLDGSYDGKAAGELGKVIKDLDLDRVKAMANSIITKGAATDDSEDAKGDEEETAESDKEEAADKDKQKSKDADTTDTDADEDEAKDDKTTTTDDSANAGDDDQAGAEDGDDEDIDLDADLTPELQEKLDGEVQEALAA